MPIDTLPAIASAPVYQRGKISLRAGRRTRFVVSASVTSGGLLAIGGLVSSILLSTTILIGVAVRESRRPRG
jgi:hypothetical protein